MRVFVARSLSGREILFSRICDSRATQTRLEQNNIWPDEYDYLWREGQGEQKRNETKHMPEDEKEKTKGA